MALGFADGTHRSEGKGGKILETEYSSSLEEEEE